MLLVVVRGDEALHDAHAVAELQQLSVLLDAHLRHAELRVPLQERSHVQVDVLAVLGLHEGHDDGGLQAQQLLLLAVDLEDLHADASGDDLEYVLHGDVLVRGRADVVGDEAVRVADEVNPVLVLVELVGEGELEHEAEHGEHIGGGGDGEDVGLSLLAIGTGHESADMQLVLELRTIKLGGLEFLSSCGCIGT